MKQERNKTALDDFYRGMNFGFMSKAGYYDSKKALEQVDKMAEMGVKWVCIMANVVQDTFYSTKVYCDYEYTPSDYELEKIIDRFHQKGISVMLKLINLLLDSYWMGAINFGESYEQIQGVKTDYWTPWFKSFGDCVVHYGKLMQRSKGEMFCLSGELMGTERKSEYWNEVIKRAREVYTGAITYESSSIMDYKFYEWLQNLDIICVSYYPKAADKPGASVDDMVVYLKKKALKKCREVAKQLDRPFFFAENGCRSMQGGGNNSMGI